MEEEMDTQVYGGIVIKGQEVGTISPRHLQMDEDDDIIPSKQYNNKRTNMHDDNLHMTGGSTNTVGFIFTSQIEPKATVEDEIEPSDPTGGVLTDEDEIEPSDPYLDDPTGGMLTDEDEIEPSDSTGGMLTDEDEIEPSGGDLIDPYLDDPTDNISTKEDFDRYINELNDRSTDVFGRGLSSDSDSDSDEFPVKKTTGGAYISNGSLDAYVTWN